MKRGLVFLGILGLTTLTSCDPEKHRMEVVRDCTGTYLRARNGQDFFVCNDNLLSNYTNGTKIKVKYDNLNECFGLIEPITCTESHTFQGKIEILEIF